MSWKPFPHEAKPYAYAGAALAKAWPELHRGDCEPFPNGEWVAAIYTKHPKLQGQLDADKTAAALQSAWRAYHRGDFAEAVAEGDALGLIGANVANKATNIYASYLEPNEADRRDLYQRVVQRAELMQRAAPELANAFYFHAQALGRYSQEISIAKALTQGLATRVKASLDRALALAPSHAEAHIAAGAYHAEIVAKVGGMLASITYGASKDEALKHFATARKLLPDSAIARIEEANGLVTLFGKSKLAEAQALYKAAAQCAPRDAMQALDADHARSEAA